MKRSVLFLLTLAGCATGPRPCERGGDVSWYPPIDKKIRGDQVCHQRELEDGQRVNHGPFKQKYKNGNVAYEGDFIEGKRHGFWSFYDENGRKTVEKYFDQGVEKAPPAGPTGKPDVRQN